MTARVEQRRQVDPALAPGPGSSAPGTLSLSVVRNFLTWSGDSRRELLEDERGGAGHDRGRLGRAAAALEAIVDDAGRARLIDVGARHAQALEVRTRCDEVGVAAVAAAGAARGEATRSCRRVLRLGRRASVAPTAIDVRVVGGRREARRALALLVAGVAGRGDDDDAVLPRLLGRVRERIDLVGLGRVRAVGEVEDADVQAVVVAVLDDPVDGGDDLGDVGRRRRPSPTLMQRIRASGAIPR